MVFVFLTLSSRCSHYVQDLYVIPEVITSRNEELRIATCELYAGVVGTRESDPLVLAYSSLRTAIGWRKASEFHLSVEPKCILDPLLPIPLHLPAHSRRNTGLWYSNGLHHLWCCTPSCYTINNACICHLCGERQPTKSHLLSCRTSTLASHIVITPVNVNKVVTVLYVI